MKFGVQLYNFSKALRQDFKGAMKEIAKIGFDGVEYAFNFGGMAPEEIAAFTRELGFECCGAMFSKENLQDLNSGDWDYAVALNPPAISVSATVDFTEQWQEIRDICIAIQKNAERKGLTFSYHNHWAEYALVDGIPAMYRILDDPEAAKVFLEPDVCWLTCAGMDAAAYIERYASRIKQIHFKDNVKEMKTSTTVPLGTGIVDLKSAFASARKSCCEWIIYEQDSSSDPFKDAADSLAYLKSLNNI